MTRHGCVEGLLVDTSLTRGKLFMRLPRHPLTFLDCTQAPQPDTRLCRGGRLIDDVQCYFSQAPLVIISSRQVRGSRFSPFRAKSLNVSA